jgi:hypothetical protein
MLQVVQQSATRESRFAERSLDVASGTMKLERLLGRGGVNEGIDDPTFLQLNDRSSELPFCCKRGHSAILPLTQIPCACTQLPLLDARSRALPTSRNPPR